MDVTIVGILVSVRKAKGATDSVTDYLVRLIKGGALVGEDRGSPEQWPTSLATSEYGSDADLWGESWLPEDINDSEFGIAMGALPGESSGRAYVDSVEITIYHRSACP